MGLNRKQAEFYAQQLHHYTKTIEPRLTIGGIITELERVPSDDPVAVLAAAWATVRKMRVGEYRAFSKIGAELVAQAMPSMPPAPPVQVPPVAQFRRPDQSAVPFNPRLEAECPHHTAQRRVGCPGCKADWLAGEITRSEYEERQAA